MRLGAVQFATRVKSNCTIALKITVRGAIWLTELRRVLFPRGRSTRTITHCRASLFALSGVPFIMLWGAAATRLGLSCWFLQSVRNGYALGAAHVPENVLGIWGLCGFDSL